MVAIAQLSLGSLWHARELSECIYGVKLEGGPQRLAKMMFASIAHACLQVVNKEVTATEIESSIWAYALHSASLSHATLSMILLI